MQTGDSGFSSDLTGQLLVERYRVIRQLGEGGMAIVYLAMDERLSREVVVKAPKVELLTIRTFRERFQREISSLIGLEHPHVVRVLDAGVQGAIPFLVVQYLAGGSFQDRFDAQGATMEPSDLVRPLGEVAAALDFIHANGYVHRDVKPGNILFDKHGHAFLGDFGIVRHAATAGGEVTGTGTLVGSLQYMPPDMALGHPVSPAYDQYALALVVYRAVSGLLPHDSSNPMAIVTQRAVRPIQPVQEVAPRLPGGSALAVMRALATTPDQRFASCMDFARAYAAGLRSAGPSVGGFAGDATLLSARRPDWLSHGPSGGEGAGQWSDGRGQPMPPPGPPPDQRAWSDGRGQPAPPPGPPADQRAWSDGRGQPAPPPGPPPDQRAWSDGRGQHAPQPGPPPDQRAWSDGRGQQAPPPGPPPDQRAWSDGRGQPAPPPGPPPDQRAWSDGRGHQAPLPGPPPEQRAWSDGRGQQAPLPGPPPDQRAWSDGRGQQAPLPGPPPDQRAWSDGRGQQAPLPGPPPDRRAWSDGRGQPAPPPGPPPDRRAWSDGRGQPAPQPGPPPDQRAWSDGRGQPAPTPPPPRARPAPRPSSQPAVPPRRKTSQSQTGKVSFDGRGLEAVAGDRDQGRRRGYGLEWTLLFLLALANGAVALHQYVPITVPRLVDAWVQLGSAGARSVIAAPGSSGADVDAVTWPDGLSVGFSMRGTRTKPVVRLVNAQTGVEVDQSPEVYDSSKGLALDTAFERWRGRGRPDGEYELFVKLQGEPPTEFLLLKLRRADNRGLLPLAKGDGGLLRVKDDAEVFPIVGPNSRPLLFDRAEVSWAQWYRYLKSTKADALAPVPHGAEPAHPVTNVTLAEASFYCRWVGGRLPERAEWQAAVGKDAWPWGREWDGLAPTLDRSSPVEIAADENWDKRPEEGIIDLTGNVAEWVIEAEPTAMGGSYLDPAERWERMPGLRSDAGRPVTRERSPAVGFRCVMDTED